MLAHITLTIYSQYITDYTKSELVKVERERDGLKREKEHEVSALTSRLQAMEKSYDVILQVRG